MSSQIESSPTTERRLRAVAGEPLVISSGPCYPGQEAGTLGMHALEEAAAALERACSEGARDADIDDMVRKVTNILNEVIDELRANGSVRAP